MCKYSLNQSHILPQTLKIKKKHKEWFNRRIKIWQAESFPCNFTGIKPIHCTRTVLNKNNHYCAYTCMHQQFVCSSATLPRCVCAMNNIQLHVNHTYHAVSFIYELCAHMYAQLSLTLRQAWSFPSSPHEHKIY